MFEDNIERGGAVSFADLERQEADRFSKLLVEVDDKLYTPVLPAKAIVFPAEVDDTRRYYSEGYEANYDGVGDDEIRQWQQGSFSYLRVQGVGIKTPGSNSDINDPTFSHSDEGNLEHVFEELNILPSQDEGLVICGRSIVPPNGYTHASLVREEECSEEEYFAQHGILQEYIEYSGERLDSDKPSAAVESDTLTPLDSQKEEVLASMMDAIWPDIVQALKPLIADVLATARDNNIPYKVDQNPAPPVNEYGEYGDGGGFDFASDDGW